MTLPVYTVTIHTAGEYFPDTRAVNIEDIVKSGPATGNVLKMVQDASVGFAGFTSQLQALTRASATEREIADIYSLTKLLGQKGQGLIDRLSSYPAAVEMLEGLAAQEPQVVGVLEAADLVQPGYTVSADDLKKVPIPRKRVMVYWKAHSDMMEALKAFEQKYEAQLTKIKAQDRIDF